MNTGFLGVSRCVQDRSVLSRSTVPAGRRVRQMRQHAGLVIPSAHLMGQVSPPMGATVDLAASSERGGAPRTARSDGHRSPWRPPGTRHEHLAFGSESMVVKSRSCPVAVVGVEGRYLTHMPMGVTSLN